MGYLIGDQPTKAKQIFLICFGLVFLAIGLTVFGYGLSQVLINSAFSWLGGCAVGIGIGCISYPIIEHVTYPDYSSELGTTNYKLPTVMLIILAMIAATVGITTLMFTIYFATIAVGLKGFGVTCSLLLFSVIFLACSYSITEHSVFTKK